MFWMTYEDSAWSRTLLSMIASFACSFVYVRHLCRSLFMTVFSDEQVFYRDCAVLSKNRHYFRIYRGFYIDPSRWLCFLVNRSPALSATALSNKRHNITHLSQHTHQWTRPSGSQVTLDHCAFLWTGLRLSPRQRCLIKDPTLLIWVSKPAG